MSFSSNFYLAQAEQSALAAEQALLPNVRERCLRAEAAWRIMADRTARLDENRRKHAAEKMTALSE